MKPQHNVQKKRKQSFSEAEEPESKMNKMDVAGSKDVQGTFESRGVKVVGLHRPQRKKTNHMCVYIDEYILYMYIF